MPFDGAAPADGAASRPARLFARVFDAHPRELPAVAGGFLLFFFLFASYFMLRPVRETFAIAGGVDNIQWLWTGTFVATLIVVPLYGLAASRVARRRLLPILYSLSAAVMAVFAGFLHFDAGNLWVARAFYIWLSVMNVFVISIAWSLMADLFERERGHRLFGQIAAGASLGGLAGPVLSGLLVAPVGEPGLLLISTAMLLATLIFVRRLLRWRENMGPRSDGPQAVRIAGSMWAGLTLIARSPYLLLICLFVLLLTTATTFLYFEQARIVELTFPDRTRQTQVFAAIDAAVQALTIAIQIFFTGRLTKRLGVTVLLVAVPVLMMFGFGLLALAATFPVLVGVMMVRRVGEYALVRPGREMLFAPLDLETKYKAKNTIDTLVYRGGDLVSGWAYAGISWIASTGVVAVAGMVAAGVWAAVGYRIGSRHDGRAGHGAPTGMQEQAG